MENFLTECDEDFQRLYNLTPGNDLQRIPTAEESRVDWNVREHAHNPNSPQLTFESDPEQEDDFVNVLYRVTITHADDRISFPVESYFSVERRDNGLALTYRTSINDRDGGEEFYIISTAFYDANGVLTDVRVTAHTSPHEVIGTTAEKIDDLINGRSQIELEGIPGYHQIFAIDKKSSVNLGLLTNGAKELGYNLIFPRVPKKISNLWEIIIKMRGVFDQFLALEKPSN